MSTVYMHVQMNELHVTKALTLAGKVTVWTFDSIHMSPCVFSKQSLIGKALKAEATCVVGVTRWFSLSVQMVLQLGIVREEAATGWTGDHLLCRVNTTVLKKLATITAAVITI